MKTEAKAVKRDPYIAIMDAAKKGRGVRLTAEEVFQLSFDDAIETRAENVRLEREERANGG